MQYFNLTFALVPDLGGNLRDFLTVLATYQPALTDLGFSAYNFFELGIAQINYELPSSNTTLAKAAFKPIID